MIRLTIKKSKSEVEAYFKSLKTDGVGYETSGGTIVWYEREKPLTFVAKSDGTFKFTRNALQYSLDSGDTWSTLAADTDSPTVTAGNSIMWKQTGLTPAYGSGMGVFSSTGKFKALGNVMSLLYGDDFYDQTSLTGYKYPFYRLFYGCTGLTEAYSLSLPATTLAVGCYDSMFANCTSLVAVPALPATRLAAICYTSMFSGCTSLTTAPELPATTLADWCYQYMFYGCSSLNYIKCLATNITIDYCTNNWVNGVASTGTFVKNASTDWSGKTGNDGIPSGWTVEDAD